MHATKEAIDAARKALDVAHNLCSEVFHPDTVDDSQYLDDLFGGIYDLAGLDVDMGEMG